MSASTASLPKSWSFTGRRATSPSPGGMSSSRRAACRRQSRRSPMPSSSSSATASRLPSTSGTTSRAPTFAGSVLVMLNNDPDWDPALFAGAKRLYYGRWTYKYESAARHGAAGAIIIHTTPSAGYPFPVVQNSNTGAQFSLPSSGKPELPVQAWATEARSASSSRRPATTSTSWPPRRRARVQARRRSASARRCGSRTRSRA